MQRSKGYRTLVYFLFIAFMVALGFFVIPRIYDIQLPKYLEEITNAAIGSLFTAIITILVLGRQTETQQALQSNATVYETRFQIYQETIDLIRRITADDIITDGKNNNTLEGTIYLGKDGALRSSPDAEDELKQLIFQLGKVRLVSDSQTMHAIAFQLHNAKDRSAPNAKSNDLRIDPSKLPNALINIVNIFRAQLFGEGFISSDSLDSSRKSNNLRDSEARIERDGKQKYREDTGKSFDWLGWLTGQSRLEEQAYIDAEYRLIVIDMFDSWRKPPGSNTETEILESEFVPSHPDNPATVSLQSERNMFANTGARPWELMVKYGFWEAGGGKIWNKQISNLRKGDIIFVYESGVGYLGKGRVVDGNAIPLVKAKLPNGKFLVEEHPLDFGDFALMDSRNPDKLSLDESEHDYVIKIDWQDVRDFNDAERWPGMYVARHTCSTLDNQKDTLNELNSRFNGKNKAVKTPQSEWIKAPDNEFWRADEASLKTYQNKMRSRDPNWTPKQ